MLRKPKKEKAKPIAIEDKKKKKKKGPRLRDVQRVITESEMFDAFDNRGSSESEEVDPWLKFPSRVFFCVELFSVSPLGRSWLGGHKAKEAKSK